MAAPYHYLITQNMKVVVDAFLAENKLSVLQQSVDIVLDLLIPLQGVGYMKFNVIRILIAES